MQKIDDNLINVFYESAKELNDNFGALGPRFENVSEKSHKQSNIYEKYGQIDSISGSAMFFCTKIFDKNEGFDYILQVQNHISNLENYGYETENIVEALRKQTNNSVNKDLYGCWVADNSIKLNAKTMEELRKQFNSKFKVAI